MQTSLIGMNGQPPGRIAFLVVLAVVTVLLVAITLFPASATRAAGASTEGVDVNSKDPTEIPNFGAATPSEKFIQSFQQQVSQQLQSSLAQSNEAQENRLRSFEQQQHELDSHIQALEQAVAARATPERYGVDHIESLEPPRVNFRKAGAAEILQDGNAGTGAGLMSGLLSGQPVEGLSVSPNGLGLAQGHAIGLADDRPPANTSTSGGRMRPGDANVSPHGFIEGRLLNGIVTQQGGPERESIVALSGNYQSANGFTADLDGCFALVQGRPEIATGRIDFKLSRLTCNFRDGASRTWDASGWLVDGDGIRGVRATIVDNTGKKVVVAAAGGAIGGVGQRISQQQYEISGGPAGFGSNTSFAGNAARDAVGGAANGAANALGQSISDYYNLYGPSLQVGGGTHVTVVLANDLRLPRSGSEISQTYVANP